MSRTNSVVIVALLFLQVRVMGLIVPAWTFDELMSKSDLIIVAERVSTRDVGVKTEFTDLRPPFPVVELNTDFKLLTALKGTPLRASLVLRHYRQDTDRLPGPILNAPLGLDFSRGPTRVYLLFLTRESADVYAPTSGQVFPEFSIRAAERPPNNVPALTQALPAWNHYCPVIATANYCNALIAREIRAISHRNDIFLQR